MKTRTRSFSGFWCGKYISSCRTSLPLTPGRNGTHVAIMAKIFTRSFQRRSVSRRRSDPQVQWVRNPFCLCPLLLLFLSCGIPFCTSFLMLMVRSCVHSESASGAEVLPEEAGVRGISSDVPTQTEKGSKVLSFGDSMTPPKDLHRPKDK